MKKTRTKGEMRSEYDFSSGVRGKYFRRYQEGTNVVLLDPDVAKVFTDSSSVNSILRGIAGVMRRSKRVSAG